MRSWISPITVLLLLAHFDPGCCWQACCEEKSSPAEAVASCDGHAHGHNDVQHEHPDQPNQVPHRHECSAERYLSLAAATVSVDDNRRYDAAALIAGIHYCNAAWCFSQGMTAGYNSLNPADGLPLRAHLALGVLLL